MHKITYLYSYSCEVTLESHQMYSESGKILFEYDSIKLWNRLPKQVQNIENYMQFKKRCNVSNNLWMLYVYF